MRIFFFSVDNDSASLTSQSWNAIASRPFRVFFSCVSYAPRRELIKLSTTTNEGAQAPRSIDHCEFNRRTHLRSVPSSQSPELNTCRFKRISLRGPNQFWSTTAEQYSSSNCKTYGLSSLLSLLGSSLVRQHWSCLHVCEEPLLFTHEQSSMTVPYLSTVEPQGSTLARHTVHLSDDVFLLRRVLRTLHSCTVPHGLYSQPSTC